MSGKALTTAAIGQRVNIDGSLIRKMETAEDCASTAVKSFPCRPCNYVRDSRHRMQNNILRSLGASSSNQPPPLPPAASTKTPQRCMVTPLKYYKSAKHTGTEVSHNNHHPLETASMHSAAGSARYSPNSKRSQTQAVNEYLYKNLRCLPTDKQTANRMPPIAHKQIQLDWMKYLRSLSMPIDVEIQNDIYGSDGVMRPKTTTRTVVTGHAPRRVSRLHIGYTMNSAVLHKPISTRVQYTTLAC